MLAIDSVTYAEKHRRRSQHRSNRLANSGQQSDCRFTLGAGAKATSARPWHPRNSAAESSLLMGVLAGAVLRRLAR